MSVPDAGRPARTGTDTDTGTGTGTHRDSAADADVEVRAWAPMGFGEVRPGDDLPRVVVEALAADSADRPDRALRDGDVLAVTSKVISKAEGRLAADRDAAIEAETVRVVATREHAGGVTRIVENRLGLVMAAAGVDASNTGPEGAVLLLPLDPDASARGIRAAVAASLGVRVGVVVTDTAGRAWREGQTDIAIGVAGLAPLDDLRGGADADGRPLAVTVTAVADEVAALADLVKGKSAGRPVAVVRGLGRYVLDPEVDGPGAGALIRPAASDMFREGSAEAYARGFRDGSAPLG